MTSLVPYIGAIVHYVDKDSVHLPAIVLACQRYDVHNQDVLTIVSINLGWMVTLQVFPDMMIMPDVLGKRPKNLRHVALAGAMLPMVSWSRVSGKSVRSKKIDMRPISCYNTIMKRFRVYCGPGIVESVAKYLTGLGRYAHVNAGVSHVYMTPAEAGRTREDVLLDVRTYGSGWTLADVQDLGCAFSASAEF